VKSKTCLQGDTRSYETVTNRELPFVFVVFPQAPQILPHGGC